MLRSIALTLTLLLGPSLALGQGSSGTGFAVAPGLVVTNHHVVAGCSSLSIVLPGQERRPARLIAQDTDADLALVYALGLPGSVASLRTAPARLGEQVYAFGFPLAGALSSSGNFTSGLVSALRGLGDREGELQFSAPIQPGNSGGPLLDRSGLVIGVVRSKLDAIRAARVTGDIAQNVNFAVSGEVLARFLSRHQANVAPRPAGDTLDTVAIAEQAQGFSFRISCASAARVAPPQAATPPAPSDPAADAERALALSPDAIRNIQIWLLALGHDPGSADGVIGPATRRALRSWQRSKGIAETGYLNPSSLAALRQDGPPALSRTLAGHRFRDCPDCPEMVVVPAGRFTMGAAPGEEEAESVSANFRGRSAPQIEVSIPGPLAVGKFEVTRAEFARFVADTGHATGSACWTFENGKTEERAGRTWRAPGFSQDDRHPVVCVSWDDARAYVQWLSRKTGKGYRLLSESEWEYAARAGTTTRRPWGDTAEAGCGHANIADAAARLFVAGITWGTACDDGHAFTSPSGAYRPNAFGLHDMLGNVWEWTADCWNESHAGASTDGSARSTGNCTRRVPRGGSWISHPVDTRSAFRTGVTTDYRNGLIGFRVARTL
jgi:sulfatase modifying factor 1